MRKCMSQASGISQWLDCLHLVPCMLLHVPRFSWECQQTCHPSQHQSNYAVDERDLYICDFQLHILSLLYQFKCILYPFQLRTWDYSRVLVNHVRQGLGTEWTHSCLESGLESELGLTSHQHRKIIQRLGPRFKVSSEWLLERGNRTSNPWVLERKHIFLEKRLQQQKPILYVKWKWRHECISFLMSVLLLIVSALNCVVKQH